MLNTIGIGTDIEDVGRFESLTCETNKLLFDKIYTDNELQYCFSKKSPASHLAARYAGKEAVVKAIHSIGFGSLNYNQIEIINDINGVPRVKLNTSKLNSVQISISLSHCEDKAIAFVIAIKR
jgi:holo-[acyl-carrier protein] synthase